MPRSHLGTLGGEKKHRPGKEDGLGDVPMKPEFQLDHALRGLNGGVLEEVVPREEKRVCHPLALNEK